MSVLRVLYVCRALGWRKHGNKIANWCIMPTGACLRCRCRLFYFDPTLSK